MASGHAECVLRHVRTVLAASDAERMSDRELLRRFGERRDEAAFAALVRRHGPMVLAVCRRMLHDVHDAEDAFQAAFFTLARKAGASHWQESVGSWLYLVAVRTARQLRAAARRRALHESRAAAPPALDPLERVTGRELCVVLDEEISRLPEELRAPLIACGLQGLTRDEAARRLGWSLTTLKRRLARGRERLSSRLARRGIPVPAALAGLLAAEGAGRAVVPAALARLAVDAAAHGMPSSRRICALVQSALGPAVPAKAKIAALLLVTCLAAGAALGRRPAASGEPGGRPPAQDTSAPTADLRGTKTDLGGDPLPPEALLRLGTTHLRHGGDVHALHFLPDGKVLLARDETGVSVWDAARGRRIHRLPKESGGRDGSGHALSPDGKWLATAGENALHIWDTATAKLLRTIPVEGGRPGAGPFLLSAFSADGTMLAVLGGDHMRHVTVWDPATGRQLRSWTAGKMPLTFLSFAGDAKTLITANDHNVICSWDVLTGEQKREIVRLPSTIKTLALSPDGKLLATVGQTTKPGGPGLPGVLFSIADPFIRLWDVATGKEVRRLDEPAGAQKAELKRGFESVAFAAGGKVLLAGSAEGVLYACEPAAAKELRRVWQGTPFLRALAASADGKTAAVASGAVVHLIDLASGKEVFLGAGHPDSAYKTAVTPDGKTILTASHRDLFLWDVASGRLRKRLRGHHDYINGLELIDGGTKAVTSAYQDGTLRVWDLIAGTEAYRIESPDKANILQAVSPDGKTLAVGGSGSLTVLYDARTGKEIHRLKGHGEFNDYGAAFTPDGRMLVVWYCADNIVYLWDLATGRKIREYTFIDGDPPQPNPARGRPVYFAAVSPDGRLIAFGSQSRFLEVRDLASGTVLYRRTKLPDGVCPMTFSPDSRMLAWSGWWNDPTVHLVEIATGTDRRRFAGHTGRVLSLSFSADGSMLVSGSGDTTALVWDLTGKLAAGDEWGKPLPAKDVEAAWQDLIGDDAGRAFDAIRRLSAAPREPVAFLRRQLKPVAAVDADRIARLIADLDADEFAAREKATRELEALGERAVGACRKALAGAPSAEARRRLEGLLAQAGRETGQPSGERLRVLRALEVLERAGTAEARDVLATLAHGAPGARLTEDARAALQRLDARSAGK
jgi:RNA polymerase sigma factor (sigma-70 family)